MIATGVVHRVEKAAAVEAEKKLYSNLEDEDALNTIQKKLALARVTDLSLDILESIGNKLDTIWDCEKDGHRFKRGDPLNNPPTVEDADALQRTNRRIIDKVVMCTKCDKTFPVSSDEYTKFLQKLWGEI